MLREGQKSDALSGEHPRGFLPDEREDTAVVMHIAVHIEQPRSHGIGDPGED
jgi:hypothetical protein